MNKWTAMGILGAFLTLGGIVANCDGPVALAAVRHQYWGATYNLTVTATYHIPATATSPAKTIVKKVPLKIDVKY